MLSTLTREQRNALRVADHIENLPPGRFDMVRWSKCIQGHAVRGCDVQPYQMGIVTWQQQDQMFRPDLVLGRSLPGMIACALLGRKRYDNRLAAAVVRNFALTGEIDWRGVMRAHGYGWGRIDRLRSLLPLRRRELLPC